MSEQELRGHHEFIANQGTLWLKVKVDTPEQAEELTRWMYGPKENRPLSAEVLTLAWAGVYQLDQDVLAAVETIRAALESE